MAIKKFTKHAQKVLNKNPNVVFCGVGKIVFTESFALKVCEALKDGESPYDVFEENGISLKILGKSRTEGCINLWKSRYEIQAPKKKRTKNADPDQKASAEKRRARLEEGIALCDRYLQNPSLLNLDGEIDPETLLCEAIRKTYEEIDRVFVKDLCAHYDFSYSRYYAYQQQKKKEEREFDNVLNPHRKNK